MISVQQLSKAFGTTQALTNLSFEINQGEIIGLLGPNGAGKTTLMRVLAGVLEPTQGAYTLDGQDVIEDKLVVKKQLGYLAENNPLYEDMIVREYLNFIADLRYLGGQKISAIHQAIKATEIQEVANRPISELSKGFRQRVGLAQAILNEPQILILDEPTEGLDPNQRVDMRTLIKNLGKDKTVFISTHVLGEVAEMCSRLIIIDQGKIIADGSVTELQDQVKQQNRVTVQYSGSHVTREAILGVDGVLDIVQSERKGDREEFVVTTEAGKEVPPKLFDLAKQQGWTMWELHREQMNLEQLFRQLTKES